MEYLVLKDNGRGSLDSASALILNTLEHFAQQFVSPSLKTFNQQHIQKLPTKFFLQTDHRPSLGMGLILQKGASFLGVANV